MADRDEYPTYIPTCNGIPLRRFYSGGRPYAGKKLPLRAAIDDFETLMTEHLKTCSQKHTVRVEFGWKAAHYDSEYDYPPRLPE